MGFKIRFNNFAKIAEKLAAECERIVQTTAAQIEQDAKMSMRGSKSGRIYQRGRRTHTASAPGEPPAIDTGNLVNSIETRRVNAFTARVNVGAEYGAALEFGTDTTAPRPFLRPAVNKHADEFVDKLRALESRLD